MIVLAGVLKLCDLPDFLAALSTWKIFPRWMHGWLVIIVPMAEVVLGGLGLVGIRRAMLAYTVTAGLVLATCAFMAHWYLREPPRCGCFGALSESRWLASPWAVVCRNAALIAALSSHGLYLRMRVIQGARSSSVPSTPCSGSAVRTGFSIIEAIVTVAIITVVAALIVPSISKLRERALDGRQLAYLRSHAQVFTQYQSDNRGMYPYLTDPAQKLNVIECKTAGIRLTDVRYFDVFLTWNVALADAYYQGDSRSASFQFRGRSGELRGVVTYLLYPSVFLAKPEYWNRETRKDLPDQLGPTFDHLTTFPSKKILLGENIPSRLQDNASETHTPMSFADGRGDAIVERSLLERGPPASAYPRYTAAPYLNTQWPFFYTLDGVRGRDVK